MIYPPHLQERYETEDRLREFFNRQAENNPPSDRPIFSRLAVERTIEQMGLCRDDRVLDIGCGNGGFCRALSPICPEGSVVGIDISDGMIRLAREQSAGFENILYAPGAAEEIPWAEVYFSRIVALESAYYWSAPQDAAREMFRVANFGGEVFLLLSFYADNPHTHHWAETRDVPMQLKSTDEWLEILKNVGFDRVEGQQLPDPNAESTEPLEDEGACTPWLSPEQRAAFSRIGPLLLRAAKPKLPPPGPISVDPERPPPVDPDPDPFRIVD